MLDEVLNSRLTKLQESDALRKLSTSLDLIDFASNDYLGLGRSKELAAQIRAASDGISNGSTGSRLLTGNHDYTEQVEQSLARIFHAESALIFNSGYSANTAVLSSIPTKGDTIIYDELAHASIKDGARLSIANRFSFRHNDLDDLKLKLSRSNGFRFVVVEAVYSMDGDVAPLANLVSLSHELDFILVVDEAHSTGILGHNGSGMCASLNLASQVPVRIYTFGKAMGVHGACVVGSRLLIETMINIARPFIYSTALPAHSIISIHQAFLFLEKNTELQSSLWKNVEVFRENFTSAHESPIQPVIIPGNSEVKRVAQFLVEDGLDVRPIISPTVRPGSERLRISLHAFNTQAEIRKLTNLLHQLVQ